MFKSKPIIYKKKVPKINVQGIVDNAIRKGKTRPTSKPTYKIPKAPRVSGFGWGP